MKSMYNYSSTSLKHTLCNMPTYELSHEEYTALSFGLDHNIPSNADANLVYTEFETHYQSIIHTVTNLMETQKSHLLPLLHHQLRVACKKCNTIKVPCKYCVKTKAE